MTTMTTSLPDFEWKESNDTFVEQTVVLGEDVDGGNQLEKENRVYQHMEFDFESLDSTIRLRSKRHISESTGLALWTSSQILSGYLAENPEHVKGKNVLELGAGLGLVGIVAHQLGASKVLATDGDTEVLQNLRHNIELNRNDDDSEIKGPQLVWGKNLDRFQDVHDQQSVIVAADVLYSPEKVDPLWETVDELLEPDGRFLLGFAPHHVGVDRVLEKAKDLGFTWWLPNICDSDDDEEEKKDEDDIMYDVFPESSDFAYYVFVFERKQ